MINQHSKITAFLNRIVSYLLLITSISLVVFMFVQVGAGVVDLFSNIKEIVFVDSGSRGGLVTVLNSEYLHGVALIILLVKAYRILMSYADDHHIDIRYMVEIAIIGSVLELLFNSSDYTATMQIVFLILGIGGSIIYHIFYRYEDVECENPGKAKWLNSKK